MDWNIIKNQNDVDEFNYIYGNFHDSVLKEICFSSGSYVDENFKLSIINNPVARFIFQSEFLEAKYSAVEIEFSSVVQINIKPPESKYSDLSILKSNLYLFENVFYLGESDYKDYKLERDDFTWVSAKSVR